MKKFIEKISKVNLTVWSIVLFMGYLVSLLWAYAFLSSNNPYLTFASTGIIYFLIVIFIAIEIELVKAVIREENEKEKSIYTNQKIKTRSDN